MKYLFMIAASLLATSCASNHQDTPSPGALVIVGGGGTPQDVIAQAISLSGGKDAIVAIFPHASQRQERGKKSASMFKTAGAREAVVVEGLDTPDTRALLSRCTLVWMPGGDQNRLLQAFENAGLTTRLRELHNRGITFGGTSAGAAIQSGLMITGKADLRSIRAGGTPMSTGLGLLQGVIIDQHAIKRRRFTRLLSAVLDHPNQVGIAIDERTAVLVQDSHISVLGESTVIVIDARHAEVRKAQEGDHQGALGLELHVLRPGMTWQLEQ